MDQLVIKGILKSIDDILANSTSTGKLNAIYKRNIQKPHFIPIRYRILGGLLQSMNIQFGNFLENVISNIIKMDKNNILLPDSGKKNLKFKQSRKATEYIDAYIADCQTNIYTDEILKRRFNKCLDDIRSLASVEPFDTIKHDIDLLFSNSISNNYVYCEIKYNDDHDTGKFVDINRKFLLTFSILTAKYDSLITPYLFYFTPKRMKGNPYIPESNILRGSKFFDKYTTINYRNLDDAFKNISENPQVTDRFNALIHTVLKTPSLPF